MSGNFSLPNAFYDLIVFVSSAIILISGLLLGLNLFSLLETSDVGALNVFLIFGAFLFLGYEYGRIAEALSSFVVRNPIMLIRKYTFFFQDKDFQNSPAIDAAWQGLGIEMPPGSRSGDKWALYYFATLVAPPLGADLIKRYAWERLSRNSSFTFILLTIISLSYFVTCDGLLRMSVPSATWVFGTLEYTLATGIMALLTGYEYYRRNAWNTDLLTKVAPILKEAHKQKTSNITYDPISLIVSDGRSK